MKDTRQTGFLIAVTLVGAAAELAYAVVNISAMPVFIPTIGLTSAQADYWIGIVGTAFLLTEGALKGPLGALSDGIGRKPLIMLGPLLSIITALLTPLVHHPLALVLLRVLDGIGAAALWPAIFSLIADQVPENRRATAMSLFNVAYIVGIALGPSLGGNVNQIAQSHFHLSEAASKVASFYMAALLFAITLLTTILFLPGGRPGKEGQDPTPLPTSEQNGTPPHPPLNDELSLVPKPRLVDLLRQMPLTLLITFCIFLGVGFVMLYVKRFAIEPTGPFKMTEQEFGNMMIVPALCIGLLSVPMGTLGDRIGKSLAVKIGIGICAAAFWGIILMPNRLSLLVGGTLVGAGFVLAFPAWMALITERSDSRQHGAVVGAVSTAQGLGAIMGSIASANLYPLDTLSTGFVTIPAHTVPFVLCGLMLTLSFILSLFVNKNVNKNVNKK